MKAYDKYRDSGVEWLGEIPEHWEVKSNKYIFRLKKLTVGKKNDDYDLLSLTLKGIIKRDLVNLSGKFPAEFDSYQVVMPNDFVFCLFDIEETPRTVGLSKFRGMITGAYTVLGLIGRADENFIYYYYLNIDTQKKLKFLYKGLRNTISKDSFFLIKTIIPPLQEQKAIGTFLDEKCGKIDEAISIKEKQIALLKEHRQIIIQEAVTKGLDKNVKLRDSGVDWIGEIPEHWEVKRLKNTMKFSKGLTITKENLKEEGIWCVNYGEVHSKYGFEVDPIIHSLKCVSADYLKDHSASLLNEGDFIFADTSEDIEGSGNFTYLKSNEKVFAGYHTIIGRSIDQYLSRFLAYEIDSFSFRGQIRSKVKGVKVYSITQVLLKNQYVWLPSLKEQQQIVDYLEAQTSKIDTAIGLKTEQIEKLKLYKQSLINDVVTGKVQV